MAITEQGAVRCMQAIETAAARIARRCNKDVLDLRMYQLPVYPRERRRDLVPSHITVEPVAGRRASLTRLRQAITGFDRTREQNPLSTIRYPGWVMVKPRLFDQLLVLNELKEELRFMMKTLEPVEVARVRLTARLFPGMAMLQVYRKLYVHEHTVRHLDFTWAPVTYSSSKLKKADVIQMLEKQQRKPAPKMFSQRDYWEATLNREIHEVSNAPPKSLVKRRPVAPHPKVMVYYDHPNRRIDTKHNAMHNASTPVFIPFSPDMTVTDLPTFEYDRDRQPSRPIKQYRWISEKLGIAVRV